ncbi:putative ATP-dependent metalloprotease [Octadecabacter antarcticus 307]|uniref:Putative ATP-dependent metalloprotease n=1 Tax=Octadecabacter antarcticus 307 TaxID=391626 RepID=M9RDJ7_9RHOB|nr:AAA family ATPase [Octadecabacter antarcticus]AGI69833.1 putative ATP-dependent metalloprotease [Octadecabacter antarcticus 307]
MKITPELRDTRLSVDMQQLALTFTSRIIDDHACNFIEDAGDLEELPVFGDDTTAVSTQTHDAMGMTPVQIEAALQSGQDPFARFGAATAQRDMSDIPLSKLFITVLAVQMFQTKDALNKLFRPTNITVLFVKDDKDRADIARQLKEMFDRPLPNGFNVSTLDQSRFKITALGDMTSDPSAPRQARLMKDFHRGLDFQIGLRRAVLALARDPMDLSSSAQALCSQTLLWPEVNRETIVEMLRATHSVTGHLAEDTVRTILPDDSCLRRLPIALLHNSLYHATTIDVARCLTRLATLHAATATTINRPPALTLSHVHGVPDVIEILDGIIADLALWKSGQLNWKDVTSSLILYGNPGNGKTMIAGAFASSANCHLVSTSYSECQAAGHLGDYLRTMKEKVDEAIARAPSIFFLDELDSFAVRAHSAGKNNTYNIQVVNGMLQHLSTLNNTEGVIVLAATNFLDAVDPAIQRSGRFDLKLKVGNPNRHGIQEILASQTKIPEDQLQNTANRLIGRSSADVVAIVRSARTTARRHDSNLTIRHLEVAADQFAPRLDEETLKRIAVHEAGHLLVAYTLGFEMPSFAALGHSGGRVTWQGAQTYTRETTHKELTVLLAGMAAEIAIYGQASSGAGSDANCDLDTATGLALRLETEWGIGRSGLAYCPVQQNDRQNMNPTLKTVIKDHLNRAAKGAQQIIEDDLERLKLISRALLLHRELDQQMICDLLRSGGLQNRT